MPVTANAAIETPRDDIGLRYDAIDLVAIRAGFVGFRVAPFIESPRKRGRFTKRTKDQILISEDTLRAQEGHFPRIDRKFGTDSFEVENHGLEGRLDYDQEAEWREMIDTEDVIVEATRHGVIERHEIKLMDLITGKPATVTLLDAERFSNDAADVTRKFTVLKQQFRTRSGVTPNALLCDVTAVDQLMENDSVLEKAGQAGSSVREALELHDIARELRLRALAIALGLSEIVESDAVRNTALQPAAPTITTMFPITRAVLFRKETGRTTRSAQWLRTIHWSANGSRPGCAFDQYDEPRTMSTILRHRMDYVIKEVNDECAFYIDNIIDPAIYPAL